MKNAVKKFEKYVYMHASPKYLYTFIHLIQIQFINIYSQNSKLTNEEETKNEIKFYTRLQSK